MMARWWLWLWGHFWVAMVLAFLLTLACQIVYTLLLGEGNELM
jgi:hypothetical protein